MIVRKIKLPKDLEVVYIRRRHYGILMWMGEPIDKLGPGNTEILTLLANNQGKWLSADRLYASTSVAKDSIASMIYKLRTILREEDIPYVIRSKSGPASDGYMLDKQ